MKQVTTVLIALFLLISILSCNQSTKGSEIDIARNIMADSTAVTDQPEVNLPERRFIRSADLKSKVRSVRESISEIEIKTRALGGYVSYSHFLNNILDSTAISVTEDSSLQIMHFNTAGFLTLRVPDYRMDSLLAELAPLYTMMVNREIRADDVSISMLAGQLNRQRFLSARERLVIDIHSKGRKLSDIEHAENTLEEKRASADEAKISNLRMEDAVQYSTVTMEIYQEPGILYTELPKERIIEEYQKPFFSQIGESFSYGWQLLKDILIIVSRYWAIMLLVILGYNLVAKSFQTRKKLKTT